MFAWIILKLIYLLNTFLEFISIKAKYLPFQINIFLFFIIKLTI